LQLCLVESAYPTEKEKDIRGSERGFDAGSSKTDTDVYEFSNHDRNDLHQMQQPDEAHPDRTEGRTLQFRHLLLQRMRGEREFSEGDLN
jgi:hypothetical protein